MVKMFGALVAGTILAAPAAMAAVDLPSEGTFEVTFFMTGDPTRAAEVPAAGDKSAWSFAETATYTNDAGGTVNLLAEDREGRDAAGPTRQLRHCRPRPRLRRLASGQPGIRWRRHDHGGDKRGC
jgi:hypothetical protein